MEKRLAELKAKRAELLKQSERAEVTDEDLQKILDEVKKINESIGLIEEIAKATEDGKEDDVKEEPVNDERGQAPMNRFKPIFDNGEKREVENEKELAYRKAFRARVTKQIAIPEEVRTNYVSATSDVGDVIPENLISQIISASKDVGMIWGLVNHTNYAVGQSYPKSAFVPTVSYVAEGSGSDTQKASTTGTIQFSHYKADCRISWTEETDRMTLDAWETYFVSKVVEAITFWKENEIINGTGSTHSHVTGILSQTASFTKAIDTVTYASILEMESNVPSKKDANSKWFMSKKTFYNCFKSILDSNGQPIASVNMGTTGKLAPVILGREVVFIDEYIKTHNATGTTADDVTAFIFDMKDYVFNENYNLGMQRRQNWDNDNQELKAVFACDGKPLYTDSLVTLTRATDVA